jgi:protein SCO1/2
MKRLVVLIWILFLISCDSGFPIKKELPNLPLKDQDGRQVTFSQFRGKVLIVSYIYLHCPDVCPVIIKRMSELRDKLNKEGLGDRIYFVFITLDPRRDTPEAIREYVRTRNLDLKIWVFLTGDENTINSIIKVSGVVALKEPTEHSELGEPYYITHIDRISLVDKKGRIRKYYKGSSFDMNELSRNIERLL